MKAAAAVVLAAAAACLVHQCTTARKAWAHDAHDWIRIGDYRDWMGKQCCGPTDCGQIDARDVDERPDGSFFIAPTDHVLRRDTKISPDGQWWRCTMYENGNKATRRGCFWRPEPRS